MVQASIAKEVVIWKRGIMVLPPIVHDTVACMQVHILVQGTRPDSAPVLAILGWLVELAQHSLPNLPFIHWMVLPDAPGWLPFAKQQAGSTPIRVG